MRTVLNWPCQARKPIRQNKRPGSGDEVGSVSQDRIIAHYQGRRGALAKDATGIVDAWRRPMRRAQGRR